MRGFRRVRPSSRPVLCETCAGVERLGLRGACPEPGPADLGRAARRQFGPWPAVPLGLRVRKESSVASGLPLKVVIQVKREPKQPAKILLALRVQRYAFPDLSFSSTGETGGRALAARGP